MTCPVCQSPYWCNAKADVRRGWRSYPLRTCAGCGTRYFVDGGESRRLGYNQRQGIEQPRETRAAAASERTPIVPRPDRDMIGGDWREPA